MCHVCVCTEDTCVYCVQSLYKEVLFFETTELVVKDGRGDLKQNAPVFTVYVGVEGILRRVWFVLKDQGKFSI